MAHPAEGELGRRAMARLASLRAITDVPGRLERLFLSPAHRKAADATADMMREAGCDSVSIDALGTVVGRYEGTEPGRPALLLGSHIDTVRDAGAFDGTLGVVAAIGVVEALARPGERLPFAVEALAFGDEENVRFPSLLSSSRALAGTLDGSVTELRDADGISFGDALLAFGGDPAGLAALARRRDDTLGYLEVHIEQGPVLEAEGLPVGVVTAINGASRRRVVVTGEAGHAGTVPMGLRRDALAAAAEMVLAAQRIGGEAPERVATIGILTVEPGATNVIPGRVSFTLDARSPSDADPRGDGVGDRAGLPGIAAPARRRDRRRDHLGHEGLPLRRGPLRPAGRGGGAPADRPARLPSGAGHDAMAMAALCPVAMLFVRCKGGISHNPAEDITEADADMALRVLLDAVRSYRPAS